MTKRIWTLDLTEDQLNRVQDMASVDTLRIIHVMYDDLTEHWVTLVECDPKTYTWLCLH